MKSFQPPRWSFFACALGLFIYQSLDAIDGKQARRTNSSSPLGELFDHGCDSISTGRLISILMYSITIFQVQWTSSNSASNGLVPRCFG